jgi:hypothetical protein
MRIHYHQVLGSLAAGLIIVTAPAYAAPGEKAPAKAQQIDLRPATKQMSWKEGSSVVYRGAGVKLIAEVKGSKVIQWSATDNNGKTLPTRTERGATCVVCVTNEQGKTVCYEVDCKTIPPPPKAARQ